MENSNEYVIKYTDGTTVPLNEYIADLAKTASWGNAFGQENAGQKWFNEQVTEAKKRAIKVNAENVADKTNATKDELSK